MRFRARTGHARSGIFSAAACALMILFMTCDCQSPRPGNPLAAELSGSDAEAQINFWHAMTDEPVTTNDQAFHGLLLYLDGKDDASDYAARLENLKRRNMLLEKFDQPATDAAT